MRGQRHVPAALYPLERPGTHFTGGCVSPRDGLDTCGKSRPPPGFDPRTVQPVASRYTEYATRPTVYKYIREMYNMYFCIVCILVWHPDDGDRSNRNVSVNSDIWKNKMYLFYWYAFVGFLHNIFIKARTWNISNLPELSEETHETSGYPVAC